MPTATVTDPERGQMRHPSTFTPTEKRLDDLLRDVAKKTGELIALVEGALAVRKAVYVNLYDAFSADCIIGDLVATPRDLSILRDQIDGCLWRDGRD